MKKITLNKICAIRNGYAFKSSEFVENGLPIVRIGEIKNGKVDLSKPKYILPNDKFESYIIRRDDILIAMSGATTGKIGKYNLDIPAYQNQRVGCFLPDKSKLYNDYLYQYLSFISAKIIQNAYGGAQPNISSKELGKTLIPIPSLENQKRIAKVLSNCENLIKKRNESIKLLDEFLKSTFLEIFGDPIRNEKEFEMLSGGEYLQKLSVGVVIKPASHYVKDGVLALRSLNIKPNRIDLTDVVYFSEESNQKLLAKSILKEGDVVFVRTGNTGTAAIIPKELEGSNCIDLIISRPNHEIMNPQYLVYFFNSEIGKRIVTSKEVGGIHKHFNVGALKKLRIPIPPLPLQNEFARILAHTESVKYNLEFSLREITNLYDSLSQKAFKGELDLSKVNISQFEEESNSGKTLGKKGFKPTYVSLTIEKLEQIIKSQFGYQEFTIAQIEDILNKKEIDFNNSMVKGIVKNLLSEEKIRTEYSGLTQQVIFKYNK